MERLNQQRRAGVAAWSTLRLELSDWTVVAPPCEARIELSLGEGVHLRLEVRCLRGSGRVQAGSSDPPAVYSERSAMIGSTRVARRAGRYPASATIAESRAMAM